MWKYVLLVGAFVLAGCGGLDAPGAQAPDSASPPAPTGTPVPPPAVASITPAATPTVALTATATATPAAVPPTPTVPPTTVAAPTRVAAPAVPAFSYPIGLPGQPPGDGFFVRHGYQVENTWFNPNHWHTGEDWYRSDGSDTAGAQVYAVAAGEVVYAGSNYPGLVVIMRHSADLYSMYGHLDPAVAVQVGQVVARGELIGTVLQRGDRVPNHLHFEIRTFFTTPDVNGPAPRYGFRCGPNCAPGPGYWPFGAPDLPSDQGWRNPTHVIAQRMFAEADSAQRGEVVVAANPVTDRAIVWSQPPLDGHAAETLATIELVPGERFPLLEVRAGAEDTRVLGAEGYVLWYRIALADGQNGWVQAAIPSPFETTSRGEPATVWFNFFPVQTSTMAR